MCDSARILKCTRTDTVQSMHPPHFLLSAQAFLVGLGFPGTSCVLIEPFKFPVSILYSVCSVWFPAGAFLRTAYPREYMPRELSVMLFFFRFFSVSSPVSHATFVVYVAPCAAFYVARGACNFRCYEHFHAVAPGHWVRSTLKIPLLLIFCICFLKLSNVLSSVFHFLSFFASTNHSA